MGLDRRPRALRRRDGCRRREGCRVVASRTAGVDTVWLPWVTKTDEEMNRGWLMHGNPPGDPSQAPRCGARTREHQPCRAPAVRGKERCRMHGGRSTGPRTPEGRERSTRARWKHGRYSAERQREFQRRKAECAAFDAGAVAHGAWLFAAVKALLREEAKAARNARRRRKRRAERLLRVELAKRLARVREAQQRLAALKAARAASGAHHQRDRDKGHPPVHQVFASRRR